MRLTNDTYPLNPDFPLHMNRLWLGAHHHAKEHFHWHSFYEISCVLSGDACCFADGRHFQMNPGDVAVFNADEIHGWRMKNDIELLVLTFSPELIASSPDSFDSGYLQIFNNHTAFQNRLDGSDINAALICTILKETFKEWQGSNLGRNLMLKSQLLHILILLIRYFQTPENENVSPARSRKKENLKAAVSTSHEALSSGSLFLLIVSPFFLLCCAKNTLDGALRGMRAMKCFMTATFTDIAVRILLGKPFSYLFGLAGVFWVWPTAWLIGTFLSAVFYLYHKNRLKYT